MQRDILRGGILPPPQNISLQDHSTMYGSHMSTEDTIWVSSVSQQEGSASESTEPQYFPVHVGRRALPQVGPYSAPPPVYESQGHPQVPPQPKKSKTWEASGC